MTGKNSREKGLFFQRRVAKWLERWFGPQVHSTGTAQARVRREHRPPDVEGTPFWVECKNGKRVSPRAALRQAREESDGRPPVAIVHDFGQPLDEWLVVMTREGFEQLLDRGGWFATREGMERDL